METLLLVLNSLLVVLVAFMGIRDERRPAGTPRTSLFRTVDGDAAPSTPSEPDQRWRSRAGKGWRG